MTVGTPFSPEVSATQSPGSDEDGYRTTADASRSTKRKFEELPMLELEPHEFVIDGVLYCPWSELHPEDEIECDARFVLNRDRR